MARATLTPDVSTGAYPTDSTELNFVAGNVADGNDFVFNGKQVLLVQNSSEDTAYDLTIKSRPDALGRDLPSSQQVIEIPFGETHAVGPLAMVGWRQTNGRVNINVENAALLLCVYTLP